MRELFIATGNPNKLQEIQEIFQNYPYQLQSPHSLGREIQVEESGKSYAENALLKARAYRNLVNGPILAEDSGLEIVALDNQPGIYSARFLGDNCSSCRRNEEILKRMGGIKERRASFITVAVLLKEDGSWHLFTGELTGTISEEKQGKNGFGYDPIFLVSPGKTLASLSRKEKSKISHRALAFRKLIEYLRENEK